MITLDRISVADLNDLAASAVPAGVAEVALEGALPPAFVAARALEHLRSGKPEHWCSTFYIRAPDRTVVGGCGYKDAPRDGRVEIGYAVAPGCRGQGIATMAVQALVAQALASGEVDEVLAQVAEDNLPSTRVVQKLGFVSVGTRVDDANETLVQWVRR